MQTYLTKVLSRILPLFLITRIILASVGVLSVKYLGGYCPRPGYLQPTGIPWLDIWGFGDTGWYLDIAGKGYSTQAVSWLDNQTNIGFFPFFPKLIHIFSFLIPNSFVAGLVVANLMFFCGCCFLYVLVERYFTRLSPIYTIAWLMALPGAFMHSTVMAESTLFCMCVISVYYGYKNQWLTAGFFGALAALTKPSGVIVAIPLCIIFFKRQEFKAWWQSVFILLVPAGTLLFGVFCWIKFHDFYAYVHIKENGWHTGNSLPWEVIAEGLKSADGVVFLNTVYTCSLLALLIAGYKIIPLELWLFSLFQILFPLLNGPVNLVCMLRYTIIIFPLALILNGLKLPAFFKVFIAAIMITFQVLFMISFSCCLPYIY